jgi:pimeloyl-ACP methyl ester carboxylesterase
MNIIETCMALQRLHASRARLFTLALAAAVLGGSASVPKEAAPVAQVCPEGVPLGVRCLRGQDSAGSHYLIAMPEKWSGVLVVHAHGGPSLGEPKATRADEDIKRWAITLSEGYAWAGSVFRQGGFAVTTAAEDTERVRRIFVDHVAQPKRTLLHGQSWGAMVATRAAEMFPKSWEGMLLTSGVVAGPMTYDFRLDLRAIYQHLCSNHPRANEPQYSLAIGLSVGSTLTNAELSARADECLGIRKSAAQRTPEQVQKLKTIVDVLKIPESSVMSHLNWGTFTLQDVVTKNGGVSPFFNDGVRYTGSSNDAALNAAVQRFKPNAEAIKRFATDVDHRGRFAVPVIAAHGIGDATVFVEGQDTLRERMQAAGNGARLVQTFVDSSEHSYWGDAFYPPLFEALLRWVEAGEKPTPTSIQNRCVALRPSASQDCRFVVNYAPKPLNSRIVQR